jgi:hypothetical protein
LTNESNKEGYKQDNRPKGRVSKVLGLGIVSAASAIAGGLAVAWWHRKTLTKLQNPIVGTELPKLHDPDLEADDPE